MRRESGASSNPRAIEETTAVHTSKSGGYWIDRSSRAMTARGLKRWKQTTSMAARRHPNDIGIR
jgi:hypothetical protein